MRGFLHELSRELPVEDIFSVVTLLWKTNSLLAIVYLMLAFFAEVCGCHSKSVFTPAVYHVENVMLVVWKITLAVSADI